MEYLSMSGYTNLSYYIALFAIYSFGGWIVEG